jgi:hypothetical protein
VLNDRIAVEIIHGGRKKVQDKLGAPMSSAAPAIRQTPARREWPDLDEPIGAQWGGLGGGGVARAGRGRCAFAAREKAQFEIAVKSPGAFRIMLAHTIPTALSAPPKPTAPRSRQFGRTSVPTIPHLVHTLRGPLRHPASNSQRSTQRAMIR